MSPGVLGTVNVYEVVSDEKASVFTQLSLHLEVRLS